MKSAITKCLLLFFALFLVVMACSEDNNDPNPDVTDDEQQMDAADDDSTSEDDATDDNSDSDDDTDSDDNDADSSDTITYQVTNIGASSYVFNGNGLSDAEDPELTLSRGETYKFEVNAPGHPFIIKSVQSTGTDNTYDEGVEGNGSQEGTVTFVVPMDAPATLFYICEFHSSMEGTLNIVD